MPIGGNKMKLHFWPSLFLLSSSSLLLSFIFNHLLRRRRNSIKPPSSPLPPSISILPFLSHIITRRGGSLQAITILLRRGPILALRLLPFAPPSIFISSTSLARAALFTHSVSFSNRPSPVEPNIFLTVKSHDISSSNHNHLWSLLRRNLTPQMLHLEFFVANLVREFEWKAEARREVDLAKEFEFTTVMKNSLNVHMVPRGREEVKDTFVMTRRVVSFDPKSSLRFFHDVVSELKQDGLIAHRHESLLQLTPFNYILQLPYLELKHSLLLELLAQYDTFDNSFTIAGHRLEFKSNDIAIIFGLPNHGKAIKLRSNMNNDFYHRIFEKRAVTRYEIAYHLRKYAMENSDDGVHAFVVLLIGLFISMVLLPSTNTSIDSGLWSCVEQIEHIYDYAWAPLVFKELFDEINRAKRRMADEDPSGELSEDTYGGCFLALQLWICEIAGLRKVETQDYSPRILCWERNSMDGILEQFRLLQPSDIRCGLSPLESERHLLDSTILHPFDEEAGQESSTKFHEKYDQPISFNNLHHIGDTEQLGKDSQMMELLHHISAEQDKRILRLEEEFYRLKAQGEAQFLSEGLSKDEDKPLEDNYSIIHQLPSSNHLDFEIHDIKVFAPNNLHVKVEKGDASAVSGSNVSLEKTVTKMVKRQSSNSLGKFEDNCSIIHQLPSSNYLEFEMNDIKVSAHNNLHVKVEKGDASTVSSSNVSLEKTVTKMVKRQTFNSLGSPTIQTKHKELSNLHSGVSARGKLAMSRSLKTPIVKSSPSVIKISEGEQASIEREVKKRVERQTPTRLRSSVQSKHKESGNDQSGIIVRSKLLTSRSKNTLKSEINNLSWQCP